MEKSGIIIVGSTNVDMIIKTKRIPKEGETIGDGVFNRAYGGKGANQAIAAARSGGNIIFVTNLGNDIYAKELIPYFKENRINADYIYQDKEKSTGLAFILVAEDGENSIAVAPGANENLRDEKIPKIYNLIEQSEVLLLQFEIPYKTVMDLIRYANSVGTKVVLNPAPAMSIDKEILEKIDILILNETEAEIILKEKYKPANPELNAKSILSMGVGTVIITLGSKGSVVVSRNLTKKIDTYKVKTIDTTGAGDTFSGAFVVRWSETKDLISAVEYASAAAALSTMGLGAQSSIPTKKEVNAFLKDSLKAIGHIY